MGSTSYTEIDYFNKRAYRYRQSIKFFPNARLLDLIPYCFLLSAFNHNRPMRILEAFAGTGFISNSLHSDKYQFTISDASAEMINQEHSTDIDILYTKELYSSDVNHNLYDLVICHGGLHHLLNANEKRAAIENLCAYLKLGGKIVLADIPIKHFKEDLLFLKDYPTLSLKKLRSLLSKHDCSILDHLYSSSKGDLSLQEINKLICDTIIKNTKESFLIPNYFFDDYISKKTELGHNAEYLDYDLINKWMLENGFRRDLQINFNSPWIFPCQSDAGWFFKEKFSIGQKTKLHANTEEEMQIFSTLTSMLGTGSYMESTYVKWGVTYSIFTKL